MSLTDYVALIKNDPIQSASIHRQFTSSYDQFIELFYQTLDFTIALIEENPQFQQDRSEDELTDQIVRSLKIAGYDVTQGTTGGGNKDITVKWRNPMWSWIGEAKIYKSIASLREGFLQLITRYRTSDPRHTQGGLIAYTFRPKAAQLLKEWMDEVVTVPEAEGIKVEQCNIKRDLAYITIHDHVATGLPCRIRHVSVALYFLPQDKSGRTAKKYARRRKAATTAN
ncbi:hypothetical protein K8O84_10595 [Cupriavidus pauculus]|nr:hypothetical protein F7R19_26000 [Cupriavidus pauculus]UAL01619.1 hypothetical protein K8O84_10595 [Cupriavidus pauculus]